MNLARVCRMDEMERGEAGGGMSTLQHVETRGSSAKGLVSSLEDMG